MNAPFSTDSNEKYSKKPRRSLSMQSFLSEPNIIRWNSCRRNKPLILGALALLLLFRNFLLSPQPPLSLPDAEPWHLPKESLGASIIFKDESHGLIENIIHLYSQGFSHIRLTDNNSKRELPIEALKFLEEKGLVSFTSDKQTNVQKWANFKAFQYLRFSSDWILAVDADEFPNSTRLGSFLNYLVLKDDEVCSIAIPMFFFGSSGRKEQPNSILQGFTHRQDYGKLKGRIKNHYYYKTVARASCSLWSGIHHSAPIPSKTLRSSYNSNIGLQRNRKPLLQRYMGEHMPDAILNHYREESEHFYEQIKVSRGDAVFKSNARTMQTFHDNNKVGNQLLDERLAILSRQRFPSLYGKTTDEASSLAFQSNEQLTNPWPLENVMAAYYELRRHQGLAIIDAAESGLPDQFGRSLRNAAMLDPTWDCIVRVPPGHVVTVVGSGLTKLCATREAKEGVDFQGFVQDIVEMYSSRYDALAAMGVDVLLPVGVDTPKLREDAKQLAASTDGKWKDWDEGTYSIKLVPKSFTVK